MHLEEGVECFSRITQYENGTKIDYAVCPVEWLRIVVTGERLSDGLDDGYKVLLDKNGLTEGMKPPTYTAYIPQKPSQAEYLDVIEEFWHESTYVAKNLWRDELIFAKYNIDYIMKFKMLRQMLEWRVEIDYDWSVKTGAYGRGLKKRLPADIWAEVESTYCGAGIEENWEALNRTIEVFRRVAREVGESLGYAYPEELDGKMMDYLGKVRNLK